MKKTYDIIERKFNIISCEEGHRHFDKTASAWKRKEMGHDGLGRPRKRESVREGDRDRNVSSPTPLLKAGDV